MSADFFLDTNVLAYTFDRHAKAKRARARDLLREGLRGSGCVSWQVVQEFCNVARRRFVVPMGLDQLREYLESVLLPLCAVWPSGRLYRDALTVTLETGYSWYDSLIVAAALDAGCRVLYSEDLQGGRRYRSLEIRDPFAHLGEGGH
jgi:predicted nucleic acid-binding protein